MFRISTKKILKFFLLTTLVFVFSFVNLILVQAATKTEDEAKIYGHFQSGISNENEYQEYIFLTGEPVLLKGKLKTTSRSGRTATTFASVSLTDETGKIKLNRSMSYSPKSEFKKDVNQTVYDAEVTTASETITIGNTTYRLVDYQLHRAGITDSKPGVDYFTGNWTEKKTYEISGVKATVKVESYGNNVGYHHNWGSTETQKINSTINFDGEWLVKADKDDKDDEDEIHKQKWSGSYEVNLSFNTTKDMTYYANEPTQISFTGGYVLTEKDEETYQYKCNFPKFDRDGVLVSKSRRITDSGSSKLVSTPTQKRLPVPFLRDVQNFWAKSDIMKLASLEAIPIKGDYVGPMLNMTRGEFAWAIAQLTDIVPKEDTNTSKRKVISRRGRGSEEQEEETTAFADVPENHPYYKYIKAISDKGIISGTGANKFSPDEPLTRAQALNIIIKTLGFEGLAPMYNNNTNFQDDYQIPYWAKDALYVGEEIGLLTGQNGYCRPNKAMTRGEAAAFLNRFIKYLQKDMLFEYRERLLYYR